MALTKDTVKRIIWTVKDDAECVKRANSFMRGGLASQFGQAGTIRNFAMVLVNTYTLDNFFSPGNPESPATTHVCTGIAEVTVAAINAKIKSNEFYLPDVEKADQVSRTNGFDHTATLIVMKDKTKYVLDWWKTLDLSNPYVFRYTWFMNDWGGVYFKNFKGYV